MLTTRGVLAFLLALVLSSGLAALAVETGLTPEEMAAAQSELSRRITGCPTPGDCANATALVAIQAPRGTPLQRYARAVTLKELGRAKDALLNSFPASKPPVQVDILEIFDEGWENMHHGTDYAFLGLVREALESPQREVRVAAARLMVHHQVWGIAHPAIDAAEEDPTLTLAALLAIQNSRADYVSRWVVGQLTNNDPAVRDQAQRTLAALGPTAVTRLKERLDDPNPAVRRAVMDAFLLLAAADDIPLLQGWLENHGGEDSALSERVTKAVAALEAGRHHPTLPAAPPFDLK